MRVLFLGSPEYAALPLRSLAAAGHEIIAVVTQPDRPAGRAKMLTPPPVKLAAQQLGLPILQPETLRDPATVAELSAMRPDVGVVAAYGEILRPKVLAIPPLGYLNVHPSLLPLYRGPTPVAGPILAGDSETGVSIMLLDRGMDSGPLLAQRRVALVGDERAGPLTTRLFELGAQLLVETLAAYASGQIEPQPQDPEQASVTRLLRKEDGLVDWSMSAAQIARAIRAYDPWPGTSTSWQGQPLKLLAAHARLDWQGDTLPGTLLSTSGAPLVATGNGVLELEVVQPAGKRAMSGDSWLAGQSKYRGIGARFGRLKDEG